MDRSSRDFDNQYVIRRNENDSRVERRYDSYNQSSPNNRLSSRSAYERDDQNGYYTYTRPRIDNDYRTYRNSHHENDGQRIEIPIKVQSPLADQTQQRSYTINPNPPRTSNNPRTFYIDVNISINVGGRTPQVTTSTNPYQSRTPPIRSTAVIEDVGYVDLDIRSPERTARVATDGIIRSSPSKQPSTNLSNENHQ